MPALPDHFLHAKLLAGLPAGTTAETPDHRIHPLEANVPGFGPLRAYLWTITADHSAPGARPPGEHKIQLILDDQRRSTRGRLDRGGAYTVLLGFSAEFGVFCAWQAELYSEFAYSRNVQVREERLSEAMGSGWAVASPRQMQSGEEEVRVAFSAGNLSQFLRLAHEADSRGLQGTWREAFFLANTPNHAAEDLPATDDEVPIYVANERRRLAYTRLSRDERFAPIIKQQFDNCCALCSIQLGIVEAVHIIPANEDDGKDEIWNGLAMCPNHHRLFDANLLMIAADLVVQLDHAGIVFLQEDGRGGGVEVLTDHEGRVIRAPAFWASDPALRDRMSRALHQRFRSVRAA